MKGRLRLAAALLVCILLPAAAAEPLRACLAPHNWPLSAAHPDRGIDVDIAHELGEALHRPVEFVWQISEETSPDTALSEGQCDVAMGAIVEAGAMAQPSIDGTLALSHPYYRAAYMLVHRPDTSSARTLSELAGQHLGVEMVSIPIFALKQRGHKVYALDDTEAVIDAVGDGRIDYGYVWGPAASALLADRKDVLISPEFLPTDQWDFAIALRPDSKLIGPTNRAVERLLTGGIIKKIFRRYEVPYLSLEKLSSEASLQTADDAAKLKTR